MSRRSQVRVIASGVVATTVAGVTVVAVALDRWDAQTEYDQTIYLGAAVLLALVTQAVMRLVRK